MEGACIAVAVRNFYAEVQLQPVPDSTEIQIEANPEHDPAVFPDLESLNMHMRRWGYYGGRRLLLVCPSRTRCHLGQKGPTACMPRR